MIIGEIISQSPDLERFREVLERVVSEAEERGFDVSTRYDEPVSSCETYGGEVADRFRGRIRVNPRDVSDCDALWDLIHEFGHCLQGFPPVELVADRGDPWLEREEDAWTRGWDHVVHQFPWLLAHRKDYDARRAACMESNRRAKRRCMDTQGIR